MKFTRFLLISIISVLLVVISVMAVFAIGQNDTEGIEYSAYSSVEDFEYVINDDGKTCTITGYIGDDSASLSIPSEINGFPVTAISSYIFSNRNFPGSLSLPEGLKTIGTSAFAYCNFTGELIIPESVEYIGDFAFYFNSFSGELDLSDRDITIGWSAFGGIEFDYFDCNCGELSVYDNGDFVSVICNHCFGNGLIDYPLKNAVVISKPFDEWVDKVESLPTDLEDPYGTRYYFYNQLSDIEKVFYWEIINAYENNKSAVRFDVKADGISQELYWIQLSSIGEALQYAAAALKADNPLVGYYYTWGTEIRANKGISEYLVAKSLAYVEEVKNSINPSADRYTKLRTLLDIISRDWYYDSYTYSWLQSDRQTIINASPFGPLAMGIGVCEGLTSAFKMLCDSLDIPCIQVGNYGHGWNYILMEDNRWYAVDVTNFVRYSHQSNEEDYRDIDGIIEEYILLGSQTPQYANDWRYNGNLYMIYAENKPETFPSLADFQYIYGGTYVNAKTECDLPFDEPVGHFTICHKHPKKTCSVSGYEGVHGVDLVIPSEIDGNKVVAIEDSAFRFSTTYTGNLLLPDTLTTIKAGAFSGCQFTGCLIIPDSVEYIGDCAFIGNQFTGELDLSSRNIVIGKNAFSYCDTLSVKCNCGQTVEIERVEPTNKNGFVTYLCNNCGGKYTQILEPAQNIYVSCDTSSCTHPSTIAVGLFVKEGMQVSSFVGGLLFDNAALECLSIEGVNGTDEIFLNSKNGDLVIADETTALQDANSDGIIEFVWSGEVTSIGDQAFVIIIFKAIGVGETKIFAFENSAGLDGMIYNNKTDDNPDISVVVDHRWGAWAQTTESEKTRQCTTCGAVETQCIHDYVDVITNPTCTEDGYTTHTCSRCGDSFVDSWVSAIGHEWGEITYSWATDNSTVTATRICTHDNSHVETAIKGTVYSEIESPTCALGGIGCYRASWAQWLYLIIDNGVEPKYILKQVMAPVLQYWMAWFKSENGNEYIPCDKGFVDEGYNSPSTDEEKFKNDDGVWYKDLPQSQWNIEKIINFSSYGTTAWEYDYEMDNYFRRVVDIETGEDVIQWMTNDEFTDMLKYTNEELPFEEQIKTVEIPALGHDFEEWVITNVPTGIGDGMETRVCSRCGFVESRGQYTYSNGELHLLWGSFSSEFFKNYENINSTTKIVADDSIRFIGDYSNAFSEYWSCVSIDFSNVNTESVTNMREMFSLCSCLESLDVSGFNTSNITDMSGMFCECSNLTTLNIGSFNITNAIDVKNMFYECGSLKELILPVGINITAEMSLNNGRKMDDHYLGWAIFGSKESVSGTYWTAAFVSEGGRYEWAGPKYTNGDLTGDEKVDITDVIALLQYSIFPNLYPTDYPGDLDFNGDGRFDIGDVIALLQYSIFPDLYPLG